MVPGALREPHEAGGWKIVVGARQWEKTCSALVDGYRGDVANEERGY